MSIETDFTASNGVHITRGPADRWWSVRESDSGNTWSMDSEDEDLGYARAAVEIWTAWVEYLEEGRA